MTTSAGKTVKDPVCGMDVNPNETPWQSEYQGRTYSFCSEGCKSRFDNEPQVYAAQS